MQRLAITPRRDWQKIVEKQGLVWHADYWNEAACYRFSAAEVDILEAATAELYRICMAAAQHVIDHDLFDRFGIPEFVRPLIRRAWDVEPPALNHGRFDLGYDGVRPPKLFEYNCDTPTAMFEAAVIQWAWREQVFPKADQFNSLHDKLLAKWADIAPWLRSRTVHFTHVNDPAAEDTLTITYLRDLAIQAGLETVAIFTRDIGWNSLSRRFVDLDGRPIDTLFHLYPWEWLVSEAFGPYIADSFEAMDWIEPIWKMLLSNKALLPLLWELFPNHPNLLPCYDKPCSDTYVKKPLLGREGAGITIVRNGRVLAGPALEPEGPDFIYQDFYQLPYQGGANPVVGSWVVDGQPAGIGIREGGLITGNTARFVPHYFE